MLLYCTCQPIVALIMIFSDPEEPMAPEIQVIQRNHSIKVVLFSTSTRFGPVRLVNSLPSLICIT